MNFDTPQELADHLREVVSDEDLIARIVRTHFPAYRREAETTRREAAHARIASIRAITKEDQASSPHRKPDFFILTDQQDRTRHVSVRDGSEALHRAIWREHPGIMHRLAHYHHARGTGTVRLPRST